MVLKNLLNTGGKCGVSVKVLKLKVKKAPPADPDPENLKIHTC